MRNCGGDLLAHGVVLRDRSDAELVPVSLPRFGVTYHRSAFWGFCIMLCGIVRRANCFVVRDVVGLRPFYYYWSGMMFVFLHRAQLILKHPMFGGIRMRA